MSDESHEIEPVTTEAEEEHGEEAGAWREVVSRLDELGEALGRWASSAVDDPENRQRVADMKSKLEGLAEKIGKALSGAADSGASGVKEAAEKTGEAFKRLGGRFSEEVAPRMATAFDAAATKLHEAADRMEARAEEAAARTDEDEVSEDASEGGEEG